MKSRLWLGRWLTLAGAQLPWLTMVMSLRVSGDVLSSIEEYLVDEGSAALLLVAVLLGIAAAVP